MKVGQTDVRQTMRNNEKWLITYPWWDYSGQNNDVQSVSAVIICQASKLVSLGQQCIMHKYFTIQYIIKHSKFPLHLAKSTQVDVLKFRRFFNRTKLGHSKKPFFATLKGAKIGYRSVLKEMVSVPYSAQGSKFFE